MKTNVLIIEDNSLAAETLEELLCGSERSSFACVAAGTLAKGLAALQKEKFDVVLLDLGLPDSMGIDTAAALRRAFSEIPIIVLTGLADEGVALKALRIDIQDYIVKGQISGNLISRSIRYAIERKKVADALRESEEKFRAFFESAAVGTALVDAKNRRFVQVNNRLCQITGYERGELLARTPGDLTHPDDVERDRALFDGLMAGRSSEYIVEKRYRRKNGTVVWVQVAVTVTRDPGGKPVRAVKTIQDITRRKAAEDALRESEEQLREAFAHAPVGMVLTDPQGRCLYANHAYEKIVGYTEQEMRRPDFDFGMLDHPDDREGTRQVLERLLAGDIPSFFIEKRYVRRNGSLVWVRLSASLRRDADGRPFQLVGLAEDIDKRKRLEHEIRQFALHDSLTGLPNRRLFQEVAGVELAQARRNRKKIAVLFLDLDRFKVINDTLGHEIGDKLLKEAAVRLKAVIRTSDTVARIGGDEFNVLLPDISHPEYASAAAQKILDEIRNPFSIDGHELAISTSIGISVYPDDSEDFPTLLRFADIAMYYAKEHGRNRYQFYNPVISTRWLERLNVTNSLRRALERNELIVHFQPLINIDTRRIVSLEALVRWQHPERGLLLPGQFFKAAEDIGLMRDIDEWVLKAVSGQIRKWHDQGIPHVCVTVNVSAGQFQSPGMIRRISRLLDDTGVPHECLEIDITATTAMKNIEQTIERILQLVKLGVQVSIDGFGTGLFSLNHLKRLPIRKLKIDRSFVRDLETNSDDRAIVNAVLVLAHSLNLKVVAEGVEDVNQLEFLQGLHCDEAQGFLLGAPMPAEKIRELVR